MPETQTKAFCCTSQRSLCYWGGAFLIFYGIGLGLAFWLHWQSYEIVVLFTALGLACFANLARNRNFHCVITGPFFLLVALALGLRAAGVWNMGAGLLWPAVAIVVCAAFMLERRFAS
ncbi:MAG TPA: hypothetical protein VKB26_12215 [Candidatus Acidoferrales bacterium]|nr:hypothetical protein [Candidatus Acidoferrales bacterium]